MFPLHRNQSVDLLCKSTDWFLYDGKLAVKGLIKYLQTKEFLQALHQSSLFFLFQVTFRCSRPKATTGGVL